MSIEQIQPYVLPALIAGYFGWRFLKFRKIRKEIPRLMQQGAQIIDVRSPGEFASGSSKGSINIPLDQLEMQLNKLDKNRPIVLCCASGARSGMAAMILKKNGFTNVVNAGPWTNVATLA